MKEKAQILDSIAVNRALTRITHEIVEKNSGVDDICLLGIKSKGVPIATVLKKNIKIFEGVDVPQGVLNITKFRDDILAEEKLNKDLESYIPFDITDKVVIIVDDVLFTGRTARAALEAVFSFRRPKSVQFAVLIDRGHRELPIRPDYVGKNVPTSKSESVKVKINEDQSEIEVYICE